MHIRSRRFTRIVNTATTPGHIHAIQADPPPGCRMSSNEFFPTLESPSGAPVRGSRRESRLERETPPPREQRKPSPLAGALEERRLVSRLIDRDPQAWQEFLTRYERLIVARIAAACREVNFEPRPELIEDCSAELTSLLFHNDLAALRRFEGRAKLSTWLSVVIRRCTLGVIKRRSQDASRAVQPDSRFDIAAIPDPREAPPDPEQAARLQTCLQQLSAKDREILHLQFDEQLSYAAIGERLGIAENSVGPKLHRAQKRLRKLMGRFSKEE